MRGRVAIAVNSDDVLACGGEAARAVQKEMSYREYRR
jgi:hypothetical protein